MLLKSALFLASAVLVIAAADPEDPPNKLVVRKCATCLPCAIDCLCPDNHISSCGGKPPVIPKDPAGRPVCAENQPCKNSCICPRALVRPPLGSHPPKHPDGGHQGHNTDMVVCPEGQPCSAHCLCSLGNVLSYLNPRGLKGETKICDVGKVNGTCIGREDLLESLNSVLFPPKGTVVIDYGEHDDGQHEKDEL